MINILKKYNSEKGITLVALVVTIIVLMILAVATYKIGGHTIIEATENSTLTNEIAEIDE